MAEIKIPYCESDFKVLREQGYIYVDKTKYLEKLENWKRVLYVRPRRFGKTLFSSMLGYYYDVAEKDNYDLLFKGLYIYDHPLKGKNSYYVLNFSFSAINATDGNIEETKELFNQKVLWACVNFINRYNLNIELESKKEQASVILNELLVKFANIKKGEKIFVIIDEYDHFTNSMLEGNISEFKKAANKGGFVRVFYEAIKDASEGNNAVIERFFATGVAPLTLDSLTSGFNIADNLSLDSDFATMCGLTESEVKDLVKKCKLDASVYEDLKKNYDGYRFSKKK